MKVLLPTPGTPEMPSRNDLPLCRQQRVEQRIGALAMVGARRFEQRDRLGDRAALRGAGWACDRAGERSSVSTAARAMPGRQRFDHPCAFLICSSTSFALAGIGVPGP